MHQIISHVFHDGLPALRIERVGAAHLPFLANFLWCSWSCDWDNDRNFSDNNIFPR